MGRCSNSIVLKTASILDRISDELVWQSFREECLEYFPCVIAIFSATFFIFCV